MGGAYLSVDLDFWTNKNQRSADMFFNKVFRKVNENNIPLKFVIEHEELLDDINNTNNAHILYNVDYHSDLCADVEIDVDENATDGTWGNFVNWRFNSAFVWICPHLRECYNKGKGMGVCSTEIKNDPFKSDSTGWKYVEVTPKISTINWKQIKKIGVCLSPFYSSIQSIKNVTDRFNIPRSQVKALMNQNFSIHDHTNRKRGTLRQLVTTN